MTSFNLVYLTELLSYYGLWLIMIPVILGHLWGVNHFEKLEKISKAAEHVAISQNKLASRKSAEAKKLLDRKFNRISKKSY